MRLPLRGSRILNLMLALTLLVLLGCKQEMYGVTIWNKTGKDLRSVVVQTSEGRLGFGFLVAAGSTGHGTVRIPIPDQLEVRWRGDDGSEEVAEKEVARWIRKPRAFGGILNFVINPDGSVSFIPVRNLPENFRFMMALKKLESGTSLERDHPI